MTPCPLFKFINILWGLKSMDFFYFQTGFLAQLCHFSPEIEFTELLSTNVNSWNWVNVVLLRIEPGSVKYQFAGLTTKLTVKLPRKSQTSFKTLYNTTMNSPSPQILGFQNTGIWHLFKNSNSGHTTDQLHISEVPAVLLVIARIGLIVLHWLLAHLLLRFASFLHLFIAYTQPLTAWYKREFRQFYTGPFLTLNLCAYSSFFDCKRYVCPFKSHPLKSTFFHSLNCPFPFHRVYAWSLHKFREDICTVCYHTVDSYDTVCLSLYLLKLLFNN